MIKVENIKRNKANRTDTIDATKVQRKRFHFPPADIIIYHITYTTAIDMFLLPVHEIKSQSGTIQTLQILYRLGK